MTFNRSRVGLLALCALILLLVAAIGSGTAASKPGKARVKSGKAGQGRPLVIGHRGASGYRPEHTLASYELAARMGADYVEPDLVSTKDGVLVARHENEISGTTNVADKTEFAGRRKTKTIDGVAITGWFTEDFTLAELRTLRASRLSRELDRDIGIYPETKHPTYFRDIGLPLEEPLVRALRRNDLDGRRAKVFVQSFEVRNLKRLNREIEAPIVQLYGSKPGRPYDFTVRGDSRTYADLATPAGLREVARYADGVGPSKDYIVPRNPDGSSGTPTTFVRDAHRAGLLVHPYTLRNENFFLPLELRSSANPAEYGDAIAEYEQFFLLGVDGVFSDNPDTAVEARQ